MDSDNNSLPSSSAPDAIKRRVCYFYEPEVGNYYYGQGHPMKPHRIRLTHALLLNYGLLQRMQVFRPIPARVRDLCRFHSHEYVSFLRNVTPETQQDQIRALKRFNVCEDCPVFDGLFSFCQTYAGASLGAAVKLNHGQHDIAINWAGGLHHAKKCEASGFCYVNDIVLAILELLKNHQTGVALGVELEDRIPEHEYSGYFGPDYTLHVAPSHMENKNSIKLLDDIRTNILQTLSRINHTPSVPFHERLPVVKFEEEDENEDIADKIDDIDDEMDYPKLSDALNECPPDNNQIGRTNMEIDGTDEKEQDLVAVSNSIDGTTDMKPELVGLNDLSSEHSGTYLKSECH